MSAPNNICSYGQWRSPMLLFENYMALSQLQKLCGFESDIIGRILWLLGLTLGRDKDYPDRSPSCFSEILVGICRERSFGFFLPNPFQIVVLIVTYQLNVGGVWIGNRIYCTLANCKYSNCKAVLITVTQTSSLSLLQSPLFTAW